MREKVNISGKISDPVSDQVPLIPIALEAQWSTKLVSGAPSTVRAWPQEHLNKNIVNCRAATENFSLIFTKTQEHSNLDLSGEDVLKILGFGPLPIYKLG